MKKIQVSYLFENAGLCTDVFKSVDSPHRFYNRNTESGIWHTATPTAYENDSIVHAQPPLIFGVSSPQRGSAHSPTQAVYKTYITNSLIWKRR